jgi:histidinol phosphatase-like PHP family hydrolase
MKKELVILLCTFSLFNLRCQQTDQFPITDLHIHLNGLTIDMAVEKSKREHIQYGILASCGLGYKIHSDMQIDSLLLVMKNYPRFYVGIQAEGREWVNMFSRESLKKLDYVVTDAMTFTDEKGRRNRIYIQNETWIDDENQFMDYYVKTIVGILNNEPINIYVNPTYLPVKIADKYDILWTNERMEKVISAAIKNGIAIEINNRYKIPSAAFIKKAKAAGVRFTVGTNNNNANFTGAEYAKQMIKECGLSKNDFFLPATKNGIPRGNANKIMK